MIQPEPLTRFITREIFAVERNVFPQTQLISLGESFLEYVFQHENGGEED